MTTLTRNDWLNMAIALAFLVLIVLGVVTFQNSKAIRQSEKLVTESYAVREKTRQLISSIKDMQTGERGYLLAKDPSYLVPYHTGIESVQQSFQDLGVLTQDHASQQRRLNELRKLYDAKQEHLARTIELREQEPMPETDWPSVELVLSGAR